MFHKFTLISGNLDNGDHKALSPTGHWKLDAAIRRGRRSNIIGELRIKHCVGDTSGHGRHGHDGYWSVDAYGAVTKIENSK